MAPYLISFVVGHLTHIKLDDRTKIYCEHELLEKVTYEFAEICVYLQAIENYLCPYLIKEWNAVVLPTFFP